MHQGQSALESTLGDRYLIERELGRGGMGAVYLARDRRLDRPVALKVLPPEYVSVPELRERFLRETRLAAGFSHPNIVPVFTIEETPEVLAFAMGFVEGESVAQRVAREGPMSRRDVVRLLQDVSYALAYAHGRGVVHRDIKPDNIMIERATGRALVMDFGIARAITPAHDRPGLTRVGEVVGTPEYMSPEQAAGDTIDGRSDLYALGLVAWFAITGTTAVTGESTQRVLVKQLTEAVPPVASRRPDMPAALCAVVDRCCAKEPEARFASAEAVVEALEASQLATPEVPVVVRLLAPQLGGVGVRLLVAVVLLAFGAEGIVSRDNGNVLSFAVIAVAVAWVGIASAAQELRQLRRAGFSIVELQRLLTLVQLERDEERARRSLDATFVQRRRRQIMIASGVLVLQLILLLWLLRGAASRGGETSFQGPAAIATFFGGLMGGAVAITVLFSSPFRRPLGERLFRATWLSRPGLRLLALLGGRDAKTSTPAAASRAPVPSARTATGSLAESPPSSTTLTTLAADVEHLRARVAALESTR